MISGYLPLTMSRLSFYAHLFILTHKNMMFSIALDARYPAFVSFFNAPDNARLTM